MFKIELLGTASVISQDIQLAFSFLAPKTLNHLVNPEKAHSELGPDIDKKHALDQGSLAFGIRPAS